MAIRLVKIASWMPSYTSLPSASTIASLVIRCPTLRTNSRLRPGRVSSPPSGLVKVRSWLRTRVKLVSPLLTSSDRSPLFSPSQLRYPSTLSSASTAATESSKSWIVVIADSSTTSLMPALSVEPTGDSGSIRISMCRPLLTSSTDQSGEPSSPV